jgi:glycolate oxidase iron-sulfur subunit
MDAWMRDTHAAVKRVVESTGAGVRLPGNEAGCCGALHVHAGLTLKAKKLANKVIEAFPGTNPILVDSAGCGAQLKDYGHLLGTTKAEAFSSRVFDVHEWLAENLDKLPKINSDEPAVIVQDPCHLRHVQRSHEAVRLVMNQYIGTIELDDDGLCCGAGGAYSSLHPETAAEVRTRKLESINRSGGTNVVSANPGCMLHLQQAGVSVQHPLELVDSIITRAMKRE